MCERINLSNLSILHSYLCHILWNNLHEQLAVYYFAHLKASKISPYKKVLLRERKRHTAHCVRHSVPVESTPVSWPGTWMGGYPILLMGGTPPNPDLKHYLPPSFGWRRYKFNIEQKSAWCHFRKLCPDFRALDVTTQKEWVSRTLEMFLQCKLSDLSPEILTDWSYFLRHEKAGKCVQGAYAIHFVYLF